MTFFTPELYIRGQSQDDDVIHEVDQLWDEACRRYEEHLQTIRPHLPHGIRRLLESYYLHDATILSMGQQEDTFVIVLQLDPPYRTLVLNYVLADDPVINREALLKEYRCPGVEWMYDEVELESANPLVCVHSILLSNGWELRLRFSNLEVGAFRSLVLNETQESRADEAERLGARIEHEPQPAGAAQ